MSFLSHLTIAPVVESTEIAPKHYHLVFRAERVAEESSPGQFLHIRAAAAGSWDALLRRPFSVFWVDKATGHVGVLFRVLSRATRWLADRKPGDSVDVLGPLGRPFWIPEGIRRPALVGGGVGIPPLYFLAQQMRQQGISAHAYLGFATRRFLMWQEPFEAECDSVTITTLDGSAGVQGLVTSPFIAAVERGEVDSIFACGPHGMLAAVAEIARKHGIPSQLSLEERMACGVGACLSCVCKVQAEPGGPVAHRRICVEGPVFSGEAVVFS